MDAAEAAGQDNGRRFFGAAQVQVTTDARWADAERDDLFRRLIESADPLLRAIRSGVTR
jgi:hypothetical protein